MVPDFETSPEDLLELLNESYDKGKPRFTVVAAEGASPSAEEFRDFVNEARGAYQADLTVLGHIQSGGSPSAFDRILAGRLGAAAVEALTDGDAGTMVGLGADQTRPSRGDRRRTAPARPGSLPPGRGPRRAARIE